eukprot:TRINITY_DN73951_c0_g1_i1.p1 TRINITY_DN73951_c0_g1~~TRINITY_DN73951_c0_g1_i1.p1  ORF type:complete len:282 (+),score=46.85 TRINITY_DN73951_c0_g1_i1:100-945(+)
MTFPVPLSLHSELVNDFDINPQMVKEPEPSEVPMPRINFKKEQKKLDVSGWTTLMVKNIPPDYNEDMFAQELDNTVFRSLYHGVRMPKRRGGLVNRGYVFVKFVSSEAAQSFYDSWRGRRLSLFDSAAKARPLAISKADRDCFMEDDATDGPQSTAFPQGDNIGSGYGKHPNDKFCNILHTNQRAQPLPFRDHDYQHRADFASQQRSDFSYQHRQTFDDRAHQRMYAPSGLDRNDCYDYYQHPPTCRSDYERLDFASGGSLRTAWNGQRHIGFSNRIGMSF